MILDTCVLSELWKKRPNARVLRWFDATDDDRLFLAAVTVGELAQGAHQLADAQLRATYHRRIEDLRSEFAARILPFDEVVAVRWGAMRGDQARRGRTLPVVDSMIAATAVVHGLPIATRNTADFAGLGVTIIDPWET